VISQKFIRRDGGKHMNFQTRQSACETDPAPCLPQEAEVLITWPRHSIAVCMHWHLESYIFVDCYRRIYLEYNSVWGEKRFTSTGLPISKQLSLHDRLHRAPVSWEEIITVTSSLFCVFEVWRNLYKNILLTVIGICLTIG
jgi:hypothetical protein